MDDRQSQDQAIHVRVRRGDAAAWQSWYDLCFDELYTYVAWRIRSDIHETEEIVQEAWMVAVRQIDSYDPTRGPFIGWMKGIAQNLMSARQRKERTQPRSMQVMANGQRAEEIADVREEPESTSEFDSADVAETLDRLPVAYRFVLRSKYLDQMTVLQIGERLDQSVKAVESLLTRARKAFREQFEKQRSRNG